MFGSAPRSSIIRPTPSRRVRFHPADDCGLFTESAGRNLILAKKMSYDSSPVSSRPERLVSRKAEDIFSEPLTRKQKGQAERLKKLPDSEIDYAEIIPLTNRQLAQFRRSAKVLVAVQLDRDVYDWLIRRGLSHAHQQYSARGSVVFELIAMPGSRDVAEARTGIGAWRGTGAARRRVLRRRIQRTYQREMTGAKPSVHSAMRRSSGLICCARIAPVAEARPPPGRTGPRPTPRPRSSVRPAADFASVPGFPDWSAAQTEPIISIPPRCSTLLNDCVGGVVTISLILGRTGRRDRAEVEAGTRGPGRPRREAIGEAFGE